MISFQEDRGIDVKSILGADGFIAQAHHAFENRPEQLRMGMSVRDAFGDGEHLAVEAGTGVGKSFAYLAAALEQVQKKNSKVLISTYTINLQEQLINKDIPFLADVVPVEFSACLAKGRQNYVCLRRLAYAQKKQRELFSDLGIELQQLNAWAQETEDGSLSDCPIVPSAKAWDAVQSEHGNCRGRKCAHYRDCFYWRARRRLNTADIIVANHALLFSDLVLKEQGVGILPDYELVVIDEAHNIEHVAEDHFGINISNFTLTYLLRNLFNKRNRKGVLAFSEAAKARERVAECEKAGEVFFKQVEAWYEHAYRETNGRCQKEFVDDNITGPLRELRLELAKLSKDADDEDDSFELTRYIDRCKALEVSLKNFLTQDLEGNVYWVEASKGRRKRTALRSAPLDVGPHVKRCLFEPFQSVVTTSATLSCAGAEDRSGFDFFAKRIGLEEFKALKLGSPFDYENQVTLYIEPDLPEPNHGEFTTRAVEAIKKYVLQSEGQAFVLFTSYSMLKDMAGRMEEFVAEHGMELLCQGGGEDRATILERFKNGHRCVLFGTDSFWQGVDVPGEALSNVIIVRLPFAVPNHPLVQGRIEKMRAEGRNPFFEFQLPTAIIKFKQGFGRLIRSQSDRGIVVVLDSRIVSKQYGRLFLEAVPKCRVELSEDRYM
ncbi:putative ATP-dependent helicase DinG [Anaerohalosphaera lusitana]|uniref:DNA 5'-3' helicase n=1 Tax=Anaerohalosphaera lusitana TaxID=1936003 RepID=A0A1U9NGY4_9BACT|nr:helicase C-terminal domain-containing protein [Anaerohalosphaera lusitana]AQT67004.1 putative ATP-dependent helicase DinG [Anaerohalosphaera lusitana]